MGPPHRCRPAVRPAGAPGLRASQRLGGPDSGPPGAAQRLARAAPQRRGLELAGATHVRAARTRRRLRVQARSPRHPRSADADLGRRDDQRGAPRQEPGRRGAHRRGRRAPSPARGRRADRRAADRRRARVPRARRPAAGPAAPLPRGARGPATVNLAPGLAAAGVASLAINGSYLVQHAGLAAAPQVRATRPLQTLRGLLGSPAWRAGAALGYGGLALEAVGLLLAPISLVQSVLAAGLVVVAVGSARLAGRSLLAREALAVGLMALALGALALLPSGSSTMHVPGAAGLAVFL